MTSKLLLYAAINARYTYMHVLILLNSRVFSLQLLGEYVLVRFVHTLCEKFFQFSVFFFYSGSKPCRWQRISSADLLRVSATISFEY